MSCGQLGSPDIGEWTHIVATFETGVESKVYRNDRYHHLVDSRVTNNGDGDPELSIGGLVNYGNHHIDACEANTFGCSVLTLDYHWRQDLYANIVCVCPFLCALVDISEVRVYSRRLEDQEVAQRYEETCARYHACS